MPIEAIPVDPRKAYNWRLEIDGLDIALVRKCNIPEVERGRVEHAHGGQRNVTKTAGKKSIGDIVLEKVMPADVSDRYFANWENEVDTLGAADYKRDVDIFHLGPGDDGVRVDHWKCTGCYPEKIEYNDHDAMSESDPIIETITLAVDDVERV